MRWLAFVLLLASVASAGEYQVTVGTSPVRVDQGSVDNRLSISIKAHTGNSGNVYCAGDQPNVTTGTGLELDANQSFTWSVGDAPRRKFYCVGSAASQAVSVQEARW